MGARKKKIVALLEIFSKYTQDRIQLHINLKGKEEEKNIS